MPRSFKHLAATVFTLLVAGCAAGGGGCSSCGITPLPDGFKPEDRVENAGAARITQSGMNFIEENLSTIAQAVLGGSAGGVLTFSIPETSGSATIFDYTICPGGAKPNETPPKCVAEVDLGNAALQIDPMSPHNLRIHGPLPVRLQYLPINVYYPWGSTGDPIATLNGNGGCPPDEPQTFANINLNIDISVEVDTAPTHSRQGYSRVRIGAITVNQNQLDDALHFDCGDSVTGEIVDFFKGAIVDLFLDELTGALSAQLNQALCQQANPELDPSCPTGTSDDGDGTCVYPDGSCASIILGTDGHMDLGQFLASISPGTTGGLDILFAAGGSSLRSDGSGYRWGDLNPVGGGATLGLYGGVEPRPVSKCVPLSEMPIPTGILIPDELVANAVSGWPAELPGPHFGVAVSERFANYALNGMYNSGLLCLGLTTETVSLLNSGTLGLLAPSAKELTIQQETQPVAIVVRPSKPPSVTFGNGTNLTDDPLVRVRLDQASFDFYIWSLDRFIRFMTATFDLDVPLNLTVTPEGLVPVLETIGVNNGKVTNSGLLREDPQGIADALADLIASQVGQAVGGGIAPIDINSALSALGLELIIPETVEGQGSSGLRKLTKGSDNYLGIFAAFDVVGTAARVVSETSVAVHDKRVEAAGLRLPTMTRDNAPSVQLEMSSPLDDGTRTIEYSYRIDQGAWHPFTRRRGIKVQDSWLRLEGRHVIAARSRVAGDARSLDPTPATAEVVVDVVPPVVAVGAAHNGKVAIEVHDRVSDAEHTKVRFRLDGGAWSDWQTAADARVVDVGEAKGIEVETVDEEGNVGSTAQAIRGRPSPDAGAGCSVEAAGGPARGGAAGGFAALAMAAVAARIGRRRSRGSGGVQRSGGQGGGAQGAAAGSWAPPVAPRGEAPGTRARAIARRVGGVAAIVVISAHAGCSCDDDSEQVAPQCAAPGCTTLEPGLIGAYTSIALSGETIWVAGYAEANWVQGYSWGDLVVGPWAGDHVDWSVVDGVPSEPAVDGTKFSGFRGGQTEPGDDVGLWTSIAIGPDGEPSVAYYDRTNRALKFAQRSGSSWVVSVVQGKASSDIGRYAKLSFVKGLPVIAFLAMDPGEGGAVTSSVRLATGASASPGDGGWSFEDVASDPATPCRELFCSSGTKCIAATGLCTKTLDDDACPAKCGSGTACVDSAGTKSCMETYDASKLDTYPDAIGDYIAVAPDKAGGLGIAFYDRIHGNLRIASKTSGHWESLVVDGAAPDGTDTGDVGMGATLFIDGNNDWHLAYADGLSEGLRYAQVKGGTEVAGPEVADDGFGVGGTPFEDGQHIVGDDANVFVTSGGEVHISYQDATSGTLRYAVGTPTSQGHSWQVSEIELSAFAGAFSRIFEVKGQLRVATWWRLGGQKVVGDVAIVGAP